MPSPRVVAKVFEGRLLQQFLRSMPRPIPLELAFTKVSFLLLLSFSPSLLFPRPEGAVSMPLRPSFPLMESLVGPSPWC